METYENTGKAISKTEAKDNNVERVSFRGFIPTLIGVMIFTLVFALLARYIEFRLGILY